MTHDSSFTDQHLEELVQLMQQSTTFTKDHENELRRLIHRANPEALYEHKIRSLTRISDTSDLLVEWSRWCRVGDPVKLVGYPKIATFARLVASGSLPTLLISDDEAMVVSAAVGRLNVRYPQYGEALMTYFFAAKPSYRQVGNRLKIDRREAKNRIEIGIAMVDEYLDRTELRKCA